MPFPSGEYTPFGYLRNPGHRASSWRDTQGGNLRTTTDVVGVEWVYPLQRNPTGGAGIVLEPSIDGRTLRTRADFDAVRLTSKYHSCAIFGFDWSVNDELVEARFFLVGNDALCVRITADTNVRVVDRVWGEPPHAHALATTRFGSNVQLAALARATTNEDAARVAADALESAQKTFERLVAEDDAFYATCPELDGDWPSGWREGLIYDFDTTRMLVQPAGGIFKDVWPAWMVAWPRVVLAEGALDMLRLAYADPALAQRAVLSMFRDVPMPNVPCVFEGGEFNMVAADGSRCGTSPAWCLPFLNLELLYLRSLDRVWLEQLYPYLTAYVEWWLEHRTDPDGWLVYKCTWESGEDGNPRLDPSSSGNADISTRVRPVELQATMAHAANVMGFFATELNRTSDVERWRTLQARFRDRTRQLFDADDGRYRDWLIAESRFRPPRPEQPYWGIDTCRYSAQSLTPLLIGEPLAREEILRHATAPWLLWPSWTYSIVESMASAEMFEDVGRIAGEIIDRVYRVTTRRELGSLQRPMPGVAPEFWPEDWTTFDGHDAYGWGATTANLLIRHLFGFKESLRTDGWSAILTPSLPKPMLESGRRYAIRKLLYRGVLVHISYEVQHDRLRATLDLDAPMQCRVTQAGRTLYASRRAVTRHQFVLQNAVAVELELH